MTASILLRSGDELAHRRQGSGPSQSGSGCEVDLDALDRAIAAAKRQVQSPLIKTEKRALKVAEAILANLNRYRGLINGDEIPRTTEILLSFDEPFDEFQRKLRQLSKEWEASGLRELRR